MRGGVVTLSQKVAVMQSWLPPVKHEEEEAAAEALQFREV